MELINWHWYRLTAPEGRTKFNISSLNLSIKNIEGNLFPNNTKLDICWNVREILHVKDTCYVLCHWLDPWYDELLFYRMDIGDFDGWNAEWFSWQPSIGYIPRESSLLKFWAKMLHFADVNFAVPRIKINQWSSSSDIWWNGIYLIPRIVPLLNA